MRDEGNNAAGNAAAGDDAEDERQGRRRRRSRRTRPEAGPGFGPGFGQAFGQGFGGFGGMPNIMQLLPLLLAMGGNGFPGAHAVNVQLQLLTWMIETWLDYLAAMQQVFERALDRLHDLDWGGRGDDEGGKDW